MIVTSYQQGADPQRIIEAHTDPLCSDIVGDQYATQDLRLAERKRRTIQISDRHCGRLIRDHEYFADVEMCSHEPTNEVERMEHHVLQCMQPANGNVLQEKYAWLHPQQKATVDEIFQLVMSGSHQDRHNTDRHTFFLQRHAGTGKRYLLSILRDMVEAEGMFAEICATSGIAAKLYRGGRTLHSLLGLGVEDRDASDQHSKLSKYGRNSQRGQLIKSLSLLIIDEASMMQRVLFEHVDTILKDLNCPPRQDRSGERPYFGGLVVVFACDYLQLLTVLPSRRTVQLPDGNIQVVPVSLLDELPWQSGLWEKVKVLRITHQIRQSQDQEFAALLMSTAKGQFPEDIPLPLQFTANLDKAYEYPWRWVTTGNKLHVDLDRIIVCPTNSLVNEHNERALDMFPGRLLNFRSSTSIELVRPQPPQAQQAHQQQQQLAVTPSPTIEPIDPELTYTYTPTGIPPPILELKIGVPVIVIQNVLHPHLVNGAMFVLKSFKRNFLCISTVPTDNPPSQTFLIHRIDFQFDFRDFKVTRR